MRDATEQTRSTRGGAWKGVLIAVAGIGVIAVCGWRISRAIREANPTHAQLAARTASDAASAPSGNASTDANATNAATDPNAATSASGRFPSIRPAGSNWVPLPGTRRGNATGLTSTASNAPVVPLDLARVALDYVGSDPLAEQMWVMAINDPRLSPDARSNLIEDLNENGFRDPDHVQLDELPLVLSRIDLIEQLAPGAMDQTNLDAFAEAYKDLTNIRNRLMPELMSELQRQDQLQQQAQLEQQQQQDQLAQPDPTVDPSQDPQQQLAGANGEPVRQ